MVSITYSAINAVDITCRVTEKWQFLLKKEPNFLTKRSGWLKKRVHHTIWKIFTILKSPYWEDSKNINIVDVVQFWIQISISPQWHITKCWQSIVLKNQNVIWLLFFRARITNFVLWIGNFTFLTFSIPQELKSNQEANSPIVNVPHQKLNLR